MHRLLAAAALAAALHGAARAAEPVVIDAEAHFPEGPIFADGALWYVEYAGQTLMRWDGAGQPAEIWRKDGCGPSGIAPFDGDFLIACYDSGEVVRVSRTGAAVATVAADRDGNALVGPNDMVADGQGGAWLTTSGPWESAPIAGKVYHVAPDLTLTSAADDLHYANGVAQSPDGTTLYVAESEAARIVAFRIGPDHALTDRRLFVRIGQVDETSGAYAYPDGIEIGPDGNLWIAFYSQGRLVAVDAAGAFVRAVDVPGATSPNLAFGPDGAIYVVTVDQTDAAPYAGRVLKLMP